MGSCYEPHWSRYLRKQMIPDSMDKFSAIAYKCLHNDRKQRPSMYLVTKVLEESPEIQLYLSAYRSNGAASEDTQVVALQVDELNEITDNFSTESLIGEGSYGRMYHGVLRSGQAVAIKKYTMTGKLSSKSDVYNFEMVLLELLTGRKPVDLTLLLGQQCLVLWAKPRLSEDKVKQLVDPRLNGEYPHKAVAKMAAVAALCVQYETEFRPNMSIVVKALEPLLKANPGLQTEAPP